VPSAAGEIFADHRPDRPKPALSRSRASQAIARPSPADASKSDEAHPAAPSSPAAARVVNAITSSRASARPLLVLRGSDAD
jgi:hypothetical protein